MLPHGIEATDWLELPEPILHPDAPQLVAARCGESSALLAALLDGEVYRSPLSHRPFVMWPWYPEQDEQLRGPAQRRAEELCVELPAFLDDPFEAAFYLRFTGEHAFLELAAELGVRADDLMISKIPRVEPDDVYTEFEGGLRARHPWIQRFEFLEAAIDNLGWMGEEGRELGLQRVREAMSAYSDALGGLESRARRPILELSTDFLAEDLEEVGELRFDAVRAVSSGALLQVSGWLVVVGRDGIEVLDRIPGDLRFAHGTTAVLQGWGVGAYDLVAQDWHHDELDPVQTFGGALVMQEYFGDSLEYCLSPDARYIFDEERILRLQDGLFVCEFGPFGELWESAPSDAPALLSFEELSTAGQRQTMLDGVTFTHRAATGFRVRDEVGFAFALHGDHWRAYAQGRLMRNDEVVAQIGVSSRGGAFTPDAETLYLLTDTDLVEIDWVDEPRVVAKTPLHRIVAAIEAIDD